MLPPVDEGSFVPLPTVSESVAAVGEHVVGMANFITMSLTGALASTFRRLVVELDAAGSMVESSLGDNVRVVPPLVVVAVAALLDGDLLPAASLALTT